MRCLSTRCPSRALRNEAGAYLTRLVILVTRVGAVGRVWPESARSAGGCHYGCVRLGTALVRSAAVGAIVLGIAGCAARAPGPVEGAAAAREAWLAGGVDTYSFTVTSSCGERLMIGTFAVHVAGGEIASVEGLDEPGRRAAEVASLPDVVPTIGGLLDRLVALDGSQVR